MRAWGDVGKSVRFKAGASARGGLRGRRAPERGSEIVQSVVAVPLVLLVVFATVQAGGMMLSVNRLTADLARACRQMDTAGLAFAVDRERFVADEVLGAATQLKPDLLTVSNVRSEALGAVQGARLAPGATSRAAGEEGAGAGAGIVQRTDCLLYTSLVNSAHVAGADGSSFAARFLAVKAQAVAHPLALSLIHI